MKFRNLIFYFLFGFNSFAYSQIVSCDSRSYKLIYEIPKQKRVDDTVSIESCRSGYNNQFVLSKIDENGWYTYKKLSSNLKIAIKYDSINRVSSYKLQFNSGIAGSGNSYFFISYYANGNPKFALNYRLNTKSGDCVFFSQVPNHESDLNLIPSTIYNCFKSKNSIYLSQKNYTKGSNFKKDKKAAKKLIMKDCLYDLYLME